MAQVWLKDATVPDGIPGAGGVWACLRWAI